MTLVSVEALQRLKAKAVAAGARPDFWPDMGPDGKPRLRRVLQWDGPALNCTSPRIREYWSTVSEWMRNHGKRMPIEGIIMSVRCRKCEVCLNMRGRLWSGKARTECNQSERTWFCTFTFKPEMQTQAEYRARLRLTKKAVNWEELTPFEQFSERTKELGKELTLFFKRVRTNSGASIRYLVVAEAHTSGLPHFHALVHDMDAATPLRKQIIEDAWQSGFSQSRLLTDARGVNYVCKYLSKSILTRVRASQNYGTEKENALEHTQQRKF